MVDYGDECESAANYELVMIALTLPLWTFITVCLILMLIHYLRRIQYTALYDKCTSRNAHFRYDFHLVAGRHSHNYNPNEMVIIDLLDDQMISTMTIQVPGQSIFNDRQRFMYRHSRANLRCFSFTIYRRHPIKDVKCIRAAHSCASPDSRLYIYGVDIYDQRNSENRFFPILSVVKYRGTQWALATTFEPKNELNFKKLGVDCHDPFGQSVWPTYMETLAVLLYVWCSSFCFGHLISYKAILHNVPLHALTLLFIVATSAAVLSAIYLRVIKVHILDAHYETVWWHVVQHLYLFILVIVSLAFWMLALRQSTQCDSLQWLISTVVCSAFLTTVIMIAWFVGGCRRSAQDRHVQNETDTNLAKTNSKDGIQFVNDPVPGLCAGLLITQSTSSRRASYSNPPAVTTTTTTGAAAQNEANLRTAKTPQQIKSAHKRGSGGVKRTPRRSDDRQQEAGAQPKGKNEDNDTLDNAFCHGSKYMKAKNRNSISQYV